MLSMPFVQYHVVFGKGLAQFCHTYPHILLILPATITADAIRGIPVRACTHRISPANVEGSFLVTLGIFDLFPDLHGVHANIYANIPINELTN